MFRPLLSPARACLFRQQPRGVSPRIAVGQFRFKHATVDYTSKYADRLKKKAQEEGLGSIADLKQKYVPLTTAFKKPDIPESQKPLSTNPATVKAEKAAGAQATKEDSRAIGLDKIVKLDLLKDLEAEEITKIWVQRHLLMEDTLSAVVPADVYKKMHDRSRKYPIFLLPLAHDDGVEFYMMQFSFHQVMFTSLLEYKTHGTNARPYLTLTHYPELIDSKGIVLMNGVISENPKVLTLAQAQILVFGMQQYFVSDHPEKQQLLRDFHERPAQFDHQRLIALTEITG